MSHSEWSRRELLRMTGGGLVLGHLAASAKYSTALAAGTPSIPGPFPGKVVGVNHAGCLDVNDNYVTAPIQKMIRQGLVDLTGSPNYIAAWRRFVQPGDVVGIKVNPNGIEKMRSSPAFYMEIINGLLLAGIKPKDIVVYERYGEVLNWIDWFFPSWVRRMYATLQWDARQQDIGGYDPNQWVDFPIVFPGQNPDDPTARRSYLAQFLTRSVNKIVNVATLKTHEASGVTLALKNLSHGMANNICRSHDVDYLELRDFIPGMVNHPIIRSKVVLNIIDGIHGNYYGGPKGTDAWVWGHKTAYFATDPVALDRIGWKVIDDYRASLDQVPIASAPPDGYWFTFPQTQPEHILRAGALGLGVSDLALINFSLKTIA